MYGLLIGIIRLILTIIYHEPICGELDTRPWIIKNVHYMYFALFSFFTCGLIVCLVSLTEKSSTNEQLYRLTYWTAWDNRNNNNSNNNDIDDNNLYNSKIQNGIHSNEIIIMIKTDHSDGQEVDYKDDDEDEAEKEHNDDVQEKKGKKKRKHKKKKQKKETSSGDSDVNNHNNKKGYKHPQQEQQQQQQEKGEIISRPKTKFDKLKPLYNAEKNTSLQFDSDINVEQKQPVNKTSTEG
ncbi:unnamed protein product [Trichobilharzia regenti]|nr:unnamed protein product [Trichobilharzia regenti]